jgi:hypothetical protein
VANSVLLRNISNPDARMSVVNGINLIVRVHPPFAHAGQLMGGQHDQHEDPREADRPPEGQSQSRGAKASGSRKHLPLGDGNPPANQHQRRLNAKRNKEAK